MTAVLAAVAAVVRAVGVAPVRVIVRGSVRVLTGAWAVFTRPYPDDAAADVAAMFAADDGVSSRGGFYY